LAKKINTNTNTNTNYSLFYFIEILSHHNRLLKHYLPLIYENFEAPEGSAERLLIKIVSRLSAAGDAL
jgi:hypothetical protein